MCERESVLVLALVADYIYVYAYVCVCELYMSVNMSLITGWDFACSFGVGQVLRCVWVGNCQSDLVTLVI